MCCGPWGGSWFVILKLCVGYVGRSLGILGLTLGLHFVMSEQSWAVLGGRGGYLGFGGLIYQNWWFSIAFINISGWQRLSADTLWKYQNRSRLTPVQHTCSSVPTQVRKGQSSSTGNVDKTDVQSMILIIFIGCLTPIGGTKFEAKRPRQDPYSHGYRCQRYLWEHRIPHAFGPEARRIHRHFWLYFCWHRAETWVT